MIFPNQLRSVPGGYFHIRRSKGLDHVSSLEANFGQDHQIRGKLWTVLISQLRGKIVAESQFWGHI